MASTAPHADSWWPGHVEPDDVVNADIAGQARHLSPRSRVCEQEWHSKDIHSLIHSHTPMHTPKKNTHKQQQQNAQLTKNDAFIYWFSSYPVCWWATFRIFGTCSTSEALSPKTVLTENSCESVQQILQHSLAGQKSSTHQTRCLFFHWSSSCPIWWSATSRKLGRCSSGLFHVGGLLASYYSTDKNICRCVPHILQHLPKGNALSNTLYNILFLDGFNSSPRWLLVTRTRGAWWCR